MALQTILQENIDVLQRRLSGLKSEVAKNVVSDAQKRFLAIYQETINDYIDKSFDVLDVDKFNQILIDLE
jgi:hypothetical protein